MSKIVNTRTFQQLQNEVGGFLEKRLEDARDFLERISERLGKLSEDQFIKISDTLTSAGLSHTTICYYRAVGLRAGMQFTRLKTGPHLQGRGNRSFLIAISNPTRMVDVYNPADDTIRTEMLCRLSNTELERVLDRLSGIRSPELQKNYCKREATAEVESIPPTKTIRSAKRDDSTGLLRIKLTTGETFDLNIDELKHYIGDDE